MLARYQNKWVECMQELMEQVCNPSLDTLHVMPTFGGLHVQVHVQVQIEYLPVDAKENGQHFEPGCGLCCEKIYFFFPMVSWGRE